MQVKICYIFELKIFNSSDLYLTDSKDSREEYVKDTIVWIITRHGWFYGDVERWDLYIWWLL